MRRILRHRPSPAMVIACIALTITLGGTSYAAITLPRNSVGTAQLKRNAVNSAKVKNFSLLRADFKRGQLPAGPRGPQGATGATGATGAAGAKGDKGDKGDPGTPATKLFAAVAASCASLARGSGAISVDLNFTARCDVRFNQEVRSCVPVAAVRDFDTTQHGELGVLTNADSASFAELDNNEVAILYHDSAGAISTSVRPAFYLAVFC